MLAERRNEAGHGGQQGEAPDGECETQREQGQRPHQRGEVGEADESGYGCNAANLLPLKPLDGGGGI